MWLGPTIFFCWQTEEQATWLSVPWGHGLFLSEQLRHGNCNLGVGDFQLGQGDGSSDKQPQTHNWGENDLPSAGVNVFPLENSVKYRKGRAHQDPSALVPRKTCGHFEWSWASWTQSWNFSVEHMVKCSWHVLRWTFTDFMLCFKTSMVMLVH